MEEKKKGGQRIGAGRKPADDPKIPLTVYVPKSQAATYGQKTELREKIIEFVTSLNKPNTAPISVRDVENHDPDKKIAPMPKKNTSGVNVKNFNNQPKSDYSINTVKHPLWKEGDPKERSGAFMLRYGVETYEELEKLQK